MKINFFGDFLFTEGWFAPGRVKWIFRWAILKLMSVIVGWSISCEIALRWISLDLTDDKSALIKVMAWSCQAIHFEYSWSFCNGCNGLCLPELRTVTHVANQSALWVKISAWLVTFLPMPDISNLHIRWNFILPNIQNFSRIVWKCTLNPNSGYIILKPIIPRNLASTIPQKPITDETHAKNVTI